MRGLFFVLIAAMVAVSVAAITARSGDELEIAVNLTQNGAPINDATCTLTIVWPQEQWNPPDFQVDDKMVMRRSQAGEGDFPDGIYKFDWYIFASPGVYSLSVDCTGGETLGTAHANGFGELQVLEVVVTEVKLL